MDNNESLISEINQINLELPKVYEILKEDYHIIAILESKTRKKMVVCSFRPVSIVDTYYLGEVISNWFFLSIYAN